MIKVHPQLRPLPLRPAAWKWLQDYGVTVEVRDPHSTTGGGFWYPDSHRIELFTAQEEAAIHELAHAWYEDRRRDAAWRRAFLAAVRRLAHEADPRYARAAQLAAGYEYGDARLGFPGWFDNDGERYAGLASGAMGRLARLPDYVREFYEGLFDD